MHIRAYPCHPWPAFLYSFAPFCVLSWPPLLPQAILIRAYPCHPWPAFLYSFAPFCVLSWPPLLPQAILIRAYPCHPWPAFLYSFVRFCAPSWPTPFAAGKKNLSRPPKGVKTGYDPAISPVIARCSFSILQPSQQQYFFKHKAQL